MREGKGARKQRILRDDGKGWKRRFKEGSQKMKNGIKGGRQMEDGGYEQGGGSIVKSDNISYPFLELHVAPLS